MARTWDKDQQAYSIEQNKTIGTMLFGRVTCEGKVNFWVAEKGPIADFMSSIPRVVFSKSLKSVDLNNTRLVREPPEEEVRRLNREPGKDIFIFGSAKLWGHLLTHGLMHEPRLGVSRIVLGRRHPLFPSVAEPIGMKLLGAQARSNGPVVLRYVPTARAK
ncbi:MAG: dihydrofolate reductase family protein [Thermoplasmata archaeon]